jgi:hypothetical protein
VATEGVAKAVEVATEGVAKAVEVAKEAEEAAKEEESVRIENRTPA